MSNSTTNTQCPITGTLAEYSGWGANQNNPDPDKAKLRDIQHIFNRMTLGASKADIDWAMNKTPAQVVDRLIDLATEQINGVFTIPAPGTDVHTWGDKRPGHDVDMMRECSSPYRRKLLLKKEWAQGMIGNNNPLNPQYTPNNGTKTVLDQEIDRAKRFKYKMSWFWSNHFVVHEDSSPYTNSMMWYKYILVYNALGNFKDFAKDVGMSQIMLRYLDAGLNFYKGDPNWEPNENYARELLELFTMGVADGSPDDYSLVDIEQISKIFSGWRDDHWSPNLVQFREFVFQPNLHDWNTKTIFGVTYTPTPDPSLVLSPHSGAWPTNLGMDPNSPAPAGCNTLWAYNRYTALSDSPYCYQGDRNNIGIKDAYDEYEKVHDIIFGDFTGPEAYNQADMNARKDRIAKFICTKIYRNFVYEKIDPNGEAVINDLANIFKANWEIAPVMRALFKSEHFFHASVLGAQIKSQLGSFFGLLTTGGYEFNSDYFVTKHFFSPAHYDINDPYGYEINTIPFSDTATRTTYINIQWACWGLGHRLNQAPNVAGFPGFRTWINEFSFLKLGSELNNLVRYGFSDNRISTQFKIRDLLVALSNNSSDPVEITKKVAEHFVVEDLEPDQLESAVIAFKWTIPSNYFDNGTWNLNYDIGWTYNQYKSLIGFLVKQPEYYMS